jgi:hypothetical protein
VVALGSQRGLAGVDHGEVDGGMHDGLLGTVGTDGSLSPGAAGDHVRDHTVLRISSHCARRPR